MIFHRFIINNSQSNNNFSETKSNNLQNIFDFSKKFLTNLYKSIIKLEKISDNQKNTGLNNQKNTDSDNQKNTDLDN